MKKHSNINYLDKYLEVKVFDDHTLINYWNDDVLSHTHRHEIGMNKIDREGVSLNILSNWHSHIVEVLHNISLYDRVPTHIYLSGEKYLSVFEKLLRDSSTYAQFYLEEDKGRKNIHVIINKISLDNLGDFANGNILLNKNNQSYERYTKTISQFKF